MKTVRAFNEKDLRDRIQQSKSELKKLLMESTQGTIRKKSGKIKPLKRDVARLLTRLTEMNKK